MLFQSASGVVQAEARAVTTELTVEKYDWLSSEVVVIHASVRNAPYNMELKVSWDLVGESNLVITNGTYLFQATGTITELQFELEKFYQGDHFYSFEFEITDEIGSVLDESEQSFTVFEQFFQSNSFNYQSYRLWRFSLRHGSGGNDFLYGTAKVQ